MPRTGQTRPPAPGSAERSPHGGTYTLYRWIREGFIIGKQLTPSGPWHLRLDDELRAKIVPEVPDGWVGLDEAAKALGVARQTVLHWVKRST